MSPIEVKRYFVIGILALAVTACNPTPATSVPFQFDSGLVGHWTFDEGSGATANDSSGNGYTGTLVNSPAWVDSKLGNALFFDSSSHEAVSVADAPELSFGSASFSIVFWIKYSNANDADILRKGSTQTASDWYKVEISETSGRVSFSLNASSNPPTSITSAPHGDNKWHHIAAVRDVENGQLRLYVDGVQEAMTSDPGGSVSNSANLAIGSKDTLDDDFFDGWLDEVAVYDEALSQARVLALFNAENVGADVVTIIKAEYESEKARLKVEATSSAGGSVTLTAIAYDSSGNVLGSNQLEHDAKKNRHKGGIAGLTSEPFRVEVNSTGGGFDFVEGSGIKIR